MTHKKIRDKIIKNKTKDIKRRKRKNEQIKKEKGITLVALIITIVVLLILAIVSIGAVQNSDIIGHAQKASESFIEAKDNETELVSDQETFIKINSGEFIIYNDKEKAEIIDAFTKLYTSGDENEIKRAGEILIYKYQMDFNKVISVREAGESDFYYYLYNIGMLVSISYSGSVSSFEITYKDITKEENETVKEVYELCCLFDEEMKKATNIGPIELEFKGQKVTMSYRGFWSFDYKGLTTMANGGNSDNYGKFVGM